MFIPIAPLIATSVLTLGIRLLIWVYQVTIWINEQLRLMDREKEQIANPGLKVALCLVIPLYTPYWFYYIGGILDTFPDENGETSKLASACFIYALLLEPYVAVAILQNRINMLSEPKTNWMVKDNTKYATVRARAEIERLYITSENLMSRMVLTLGFYGFYWIYRMTKVLNQVPHFERRSPELAVLFTIFIPGYCSYWVYETSIRTQRLSEYKKHPVDIITVNSLVSVFTGVFFASQLIQKVINRVVINTYEKEHGALHSKYDDVTLVSKMYFTIHFNRMDEKLERRDWNWSAFFVTPFWFFYRKYYTYGILTTLADFVGFSFILYSMVSNVVWGAVGLLIILLSHTAFGFFANSFYRNRVEKILAEGRTISSDQERETMFHQRGGVSVSSVVALAAVAVMFYSCSSVFVAEEMKDMYAANMMYTYGVFDTDYTSDIDPYFLDESNNIITPENKKKLEEAAKQAKAERMKEKEKEATRNETIAELIQLGKAIFT